jgi:hypothetical protein
MRQPFLLLTFVLGLICACNSNDHSQPTSTSRLVPEPDISERLQYQKALIDTLFSHNKDSVEVLVKLTDKADLIPYKDSILPDETETSFYVLRDSLKHIVAITESPYSQSSDWFLTLTHYFDKNEHTFSFERQMNFFNSGCTEGVAYETRIEFYNNELKPVRKEYKLVDEKGKDLTKDSCELMYDNDYKVLPNVKEYLQVYRIKNGR